MCTAEEISLDGTFATAPGPFKQIVRKEPYDKLMSVLMELKAFAEGLLRGGLCATFREASPRSSPNACRGLRYKLLLLGNCIPAAAEINVKIFLVWFSGGGHVVFV
jgi:hypothetical protein